MTSNKLQTEQTQTDWYNLNIKEREKYFMQNGYNLKQFWEFISRGRTDFVMEIRIKTEFKNILSIGKQYNLPVSSSGVFVKSYKQLLFILQKIRNKYTIWFGINPKKKSFHKRTPKFKTYNGTDHSVEALTHLFIDIDRAEKNTEDDTGATSQDLQKTLNFTNNVLIPDLEKIGIKEHMVIYSGNGVQLIVPLDEAIFISDMEWNLEDREYELTDDFMNMRTLARDTFGAKLRKKYNTNKIKNEFNIKIDKQVFNLGRVAALPYTYNMKYEIPVMRGILNIQSDKGINTGLSDGLFRDLEHLNLPIFSSKTKQDYKLNSSFRLKEDTIVNDKLVKFMLQENLPQGGRHSRLFLSLKCLIVDNDLNINSKTCQHILNQIKRKNKNSDNWQTNNPRDSGDYHFNPEVVNNYCIDNMLPLLYVPYQNKVTKRNIPEHIWTINNFEYSTGTITEFPTDTTIKSDILLISKNYDIQTIYDYIRGLIQKYGKKNALYIFTEYLPHYCKK